MIESRSPTLDVAALIAQLGARPSRITSDSRVVAPGVAFAAYRGTTRDGRDFIPDAVSRGASAVLWEARGFHWDAALSTPNRPVERLREKLGPIADFIYGRPSQSLWVIGVTGTNGKTSCAQWIAQAFDALGRRAAVIGTLGSGLVGKLAPLANTTPDAALLQESLAKLLDDGARVVTIEVSSIGIEQGRVNGTKFDVALFTNLSRDHLDFHSTMAAYGAAKAKLFAWPTLAAAVVNVDDAFGRDLAASLRPRVRTLTYGLDNADITASAVEPTTEGMRLDVVTPFGAADLATNFVGSFNALNVLGTLGVLLASGVSLDDAARVLASLKPPPGRMERHGGAEKPLVIVDYAHTPDALEHVLTALRPMVTRSGSLVCVFGCGGDRDAGKRPQMGRVAASLADRIVITSDNPRSEDPTSIAMAIAQGVRATGNRRWTLEIDRAIAVQQAIANARPGDVVLIAGKGHEDHQEIKGERRAFSDAEHADLALEKWGSQ